MNFSVDPLRVIFKEIDRFHHRLGSDVELNFRVNSEVARRLPLKGVLPKDIKDGFKFQLGSSATILVDDAIPDIQVEARYMLTSLIAEGSFVPTT